MLLFVLLYLIYYELLIKYKLGKLKSKVSI